MKRWIILIILTLFLVPLVSGTLCEERLTPGKNCTMFTPIISCTQYNYSIYNLSEIVTSQNLTNVSDSIFSLDINLSQGNYVVALCEGSTRELIVEGKDEMASVAITLFILAVTLTLFALPFFKDRFTKNEFTNIIFKRGIWTISIYLMMLNSSMMATIAEFAGLNLTREMFRYMWLFGTAGWILMGYMTFMMLLDLTKLWKLKKQEKRESY